MQRGWLMMLTVSADIQLYKIHKIGNVWGQSGDFIVGKRQFSQLKEAKEALKTRNKSNIQGPISLQILKIDQWLTWQIEAHTLGSSRSWFASRSNSSKLRVYLNISSGTAVRLQCRLSMNSTCRLQAFQKGKHLNIVRIV